MVAGEAEETVSEAQFVSIRIIRMKEKNWRRVRIYHHITEPE